jgi:glycosyltransferase involved in cell wall biosynthesis
MRVLFLTPWPIAPLSHGGRVRSFRLAAGLVRCGASVDIACPWGPGEPRREHWRDGVRIRPKLFAAVPLLPISDDVLPSEVAIAWQSRLPGSRSLFGDLDGYDVVQVASPGYAPWLERIREPRLRVYLSANVEGDFARERSAGSGAVRRRLAERVAQLEARTVAASELTLACTERDAARFRELCAGAAVSVVPNGFDDALLALDRTALRDGARRELAASDGERIVLFVGGGADHNLRAVRFLEQEVAPRLGASARILVAGKAADAVRDGGAVASVGYVEDMRPLLAAADVAVNPVPYGSGSNLKVAEYLAAGLPVVTTPIGARGFESWRDRMQVVELGDFPDAIAAAPPPGAPPGGIEELGWNRIAARLHELYTRSRR